MSIQLRLSFLIITLFIAAISNSVFTFWLEHLGEKKLNWVNHTHEVLYTTQSLLSAMKDTETGQRGFLLTQDSSYLEPYHSGLTEAKQQFATLKHLTSDNPKQQQLLIKIDEQMQFKFDELAHTIALVQSGKIDEAYSIVSDDHGKQHMDTIREYFSVFTNTELLLLEERKGDFRENRAGITTLVVVQAATFAGLIVITFLFLNKSLFSPLKLLIKSANKIERGKKLEARDIVSNDEMGQLLSAFYNMGDTVYERKQALENEIRHDSLTGLRNRSTLLDEIDSAIHEIVNSNQKVAILFIDLDAFKQINDRLGHDCGDHILKETALRLSASVRSSDIVFRIGGDEFLVVLRSVKGTDKVIEIVDNVYRSFESPVNIKGEPIEIQISIGVAIAPDNSKDSAELIKFSDIAMYASKNDDDIGHALFSRDMLKREGD